MIVILGNFQDRRPIIISDFDDNGDDMPHVFESFDQARAFTCSGHIGLQACSSICIVDINTGETELL